MVCEYPGYSCEAGIGFLHQSRKGWVVSGSCFRKSPEKFLLAISDSPPTRKRPGAQGSRAGLAHASTVWQGLLAWLQHRSHGATEALFGARLCSCKEAPSGSRKMDRKKQECNLYHVFLSPLIATRMKISHSFRK